MASHVIAAVRWTALSNILRAAISFLQLLILARLVPPAEFGLYAIVGIILSISSNVTDAGIGSAIIHYRQMTEQQKNSLFWFSILVSGAICIFISSTAGIVSWYYGQPRLQSLIIISTSILVINASCQQIKAAAERDMRFNSLAKIEISASLVSTIVAVLFALEGKGAMSIIMAQVSFSAFSALLVWVLMSGGWRPKLEFCVHSIKKFITYGLAILSANIANIATSQLDVFFLANVVSVENLGYYTQPRDFCQRIMQVINPILTRVSFPHMAQHQDDRQRLASIYLKTLLMGISVNVFVFGFMIVFAPNLVPLLFGKQWIPSIHFMQLLAFWCLCRSVNNPIGSFLMAVGATRTAFVQSAGMAVSALVAIGIVHSEGPFAVAWVMIVLQIALMPIIWLGIVGRRCGVGSLQFLANTAPPCIAAVISFALGYVISIAASSPLLSLIAGGLTSGIFYLAISAAINRPWIDELARLFGVAKFV